MNKKTRLDLLLVKRGIIPAREQAKRAIMAGLVFVDGYRADKAGQTYPEDAKIEVRGGNCPYVSRGGIKLKKALEVFAIDPTGRIVLDIGASTGGFTDCMLQNGATKIYAVDVGYGQLAWKLRQNSQIINLERINARYLNRSDIPDKIDLITIDVSFISLTKILPVIKDFLNPNGKIIALIKPQFEAGKGQVGKGGVIRKKDIHIQVITDILQFCFNLGFSLYGLTYSPVQGPAGNIEFLMCLDMSGKSQEDIKNEIETCVTEAHCQFFP